MSTTRSPETGEAVDYSRKWLVMTAVVAGILLATIDSSIVNIAFPTLVQDLDTTFNVIQWVSLAYLLTNATFTLGIGRLGDVVGKKRLYVAGFVIFTTASALCGFAPTVAWLIGFRALQALGAVLIMALGSAILVEAFPPQERGKALGFVGSAVSIGIITGPALGGVIISSFGWRPIFLVNIPIGIAGTWLALRNVPQKPPVAGQRLDIPGTVLLSVALLSLSSAVTLGQDLGFASPPILAGFVAFAVLVLAFVRVELRNPSPMIELRLFRNPMLTVSVISGFLAFACLSVTFLLMPFYLEEILGLQVGFVGLLLGVQPLVMGLVAPVSGTLSDRIGIRRLTLIGLSLQLVALLVFRTFTVDTTPAQFLLFAIPLGLGLGIFQSPNNSAIMGSVPPAYMGLGGGIMTLTRLLGITTGVAVLGSVWAANVAGQLGGSLPPGGATAAPPLAQVAALRSTMTVAAVIIGVALVIGVWGLRHESRTKSTAR
ncbi:MAG TPA: MFS transporter [Acidimicrobiia bacterium]